MRILIVGAGATYAEALAAGLPEDLCPPLIANFAQKLWSDYNPSELLASYLSYEGYEVKEDPLVLFFRLEQMPAGHVNIERFFEFAYANKNQFPGAYENLIYHGILNPLVFILLQGLWKAGDIMKCPLPCTVAVASKLQPGDAVINLNYETIFDIGAIQAGHDLVFLPNALNNNKLTVCKPHGSFNMVVNEEKKAFAFGKLDWPGTPQPADGSKNYVGFIPPRLKKSYRQHWVSSMILEPTRTFHPHVLTFWGVGLTESDTDLLELYRSWSKSAEKVEFINPSRAAMLRAEKLIGKPIEHFVELTQWKP